MKRPSPKICPISVDWSKLKIPNYAQVSLICSYYMLQSGELAVFNNSDITNWGVNLHPHPTHIRVKTFDKIAVDLACIIACIS